MKNNRNECLTDVKKELRRKVMQRRDEVDSIKRKEMDKQIFLNVIECKHYAKASVIFLFVNYLSEVDTRSIIEHALMTGKTVCVPRVKSKKEGLELVRILSLSDLAEGFHGIFEPKASCELVDKETLDLILMPGVAFDLEGGRIGYGGGFYDRFVGDLKKKVKKIAIAYELQLLEAIPMEEHDARIDGIITEKRVRVF